MGGKYLLFLALQSIRGTINQAMVGVVVMVGVHVFGVSGVGQSTIGEKT